MDLDSGLGRNLPAVHDFLSPASKSLLITTERMPERMQNCSSHEAVSVMCILTELAFLGPDLRWQLGVDDVRSNPSLATGEWRLKVLVSKLATCICNKGALQLSNRTQLSAQ